jgi:hypothetical protein
MKKTHFLVAVSALFILAGCGGSSSVVAEYRLLKVVILTQMKHVHETDAKIHSAADSDTTC